MAWNPTDIAYKKLIGRVVTSSNFAYYSEESAVTQNFHNSELWVDEIAGDPASADSGVAKKETKLLLIRENKVGSHQAYYAADPVTGDRLTGWIPEKYNAAGLDPLLGYGVKVYSGGTPSSGYVTGGAEVAIGNSVNWLFDYETGYLLFNSDPTSLGLAEPFSITGHRYVGRLGLDGNVVKERARVATTPGTNMSGWVYDSNSMSIDTANTAGVLAIDGVNLNTYNSLRRNDRVLIKDFSGADKYKNGIYVVSESGNGASVTWKFTRAADCDSDADVYAGMVVFVDGGTINASTVWGMSNPLFSELDSTDSPDGDIVFTKGAAGSGVVAGTGQRIPKFDAPLNSVSHNLVNSVLYEKDGNLYCEGTIFGISKSFRIQHPTKDGKYLVHGSLEGPENGMYARGRMKGEEVVCINLPDYWTSLVGSDYDIFITSYSNVPVYVKSSDEYGFKVAAVGKKKFWQKKRKIEFSFLVIGARNDVSLVVEQD
jgi:hypothetical protein